MHQISGCFKEHLILNHLTNFPHQKCNYSNEKWSSFPTKQLIVKIKIFHLTGFGAKTWTFGAKSWFFPKRKHSFLWGLEDILQLSFVSLLSPFCFFSFSSYLSSSSPEIQISSLFACPGKHNTYHIVSNVNLSFYRSFSYLEKYFYFKFNTNELSSLDFLSLNPTSSSFSCLSAYAPIREAIKK